MSLYEIKFIMKKNTLALTHKQKHETQQTYITCYIYTITDVHYHTHILKLNIQLYA